jgi:hypothetical protein
MSDPCRCQGPRPRTAFGGGLLYSKVVLSRPRSLALSGPNSVRLTSTLPFELKQSCKI